MKSSDTIKFPAPLNDFMYIHTLIKLPIFFQNKRESSSLLESSTQNHSNYTILHLVFSHTAVKPSNRIFPTKGPFQELPVASMHVGLGAGTAASLLSDPRQQHKFQVGWLKRKLTPLTSFESMQFSLHRAEDWSFSFQFSG